MPRNAPKIKEIVHGRTRTLIWSWDSKINVPMATAGGFLSILKNNLEAFLLQL